MERLMRKFFKGFQECNPKMILDCFSEDATITSAEDFEPVTYDTWGGMIEGIQNTLEDLEYKVISKDESFIAVIVTTKLDGITIRYYIVARGQKRDGVLKFNFIHFSPRHDESQKSLTWIASRLREIEETGLISDANRSGLQQEILRVELENERLRQTLSRNHNLMATGRVERLNRNTNPVIFRLTGHNINQAFYIDPLMFRARELENGWLIKITESDPVPNDQGRERTRFWMVRKWERIEVLNNDTLDSGQ